MDSIDIPFSHKKKNPLMTINQERKRNKSSQNDIFENVHPIKREKNKTILDYSITNDGIEKAEELKQLKKRQSLLPTG